MSWNDATPTLVEALAVDNTPSSLLAALRDPNDRTARIRFGVLFAEVVFGMMRGTGLANPDAREASQELLLRLLTTDRLSSSARQEGKSFRGWLRTVVHHAALDYRRKRAADRLCPLGDRDAAAPEMSEHDYRIARLRGVLRVIQNDFKESVVAYLGEPGR